MLYPKRWKEKKVSTESDIDGYYFTAPIVIHIEEMREKDGRLHASKDSLLMMTRMEIRNPFIRFRKRYFTEETSLRYSNHSATVENTELSLRLKKYLM